MPQNTKSDSSKETTFLDELASELLDRLDEARNIEDLVMSLKIQKLLIRAILILLE